MYMYLHFNSADVYSTIYKIWDGDSYCGFIFRGSFNDVVSSSDYIDSNDWMIMINELEIIWKEAVVT
jgi:hypothetical protein